MLSSPPRFSAPNYKLDVGERQVDLVRLFSNITPPITPSKLAMVSEGNTKFNHTPGSDNDVSAAIQHDDDDDDTIPDLIPYREGDDVCLCCCSGEAFERAWAELSPEYHRTKEMGPGERQELFPAYFAKSKL